MNKYNQLKYFTLAGILFISVFGISGCASKTQTSDGETELETETEIETETETYKSIADTSANEIETPSGIEIVSDYTQFEQVTASQEYNADTDNQRSLQAGGSIECIETENSIYVNCSHYYVIDKENKTWSYLCSKPECTHAYGEDCEAYIAGEGLYYYEGSPYTVYSEGAFDEAGNYILTMYLAKMALDGAIEEKICQIAKTYTSAESLGESSSDSIYGIIHRGYFYYIYTIGSSGYEDSLFYNNNSNMLYRVKLDGSGEPELIMAIKAGGDFNFVQMKGDGSYVYFGNPDALGFGELYRLNTESGLVEAMDIGTIALEDYAVAEGKVYYKKNYDDYDIYLYDPMTNTEEIVVAAPDVSDFGCRNIDTDAEYLYTFYTSEINTEVYEIYVTTLDGEFVIMLEVPSADEKYETLILMSDYIILRYNNTKQESDGTEGLAVEYIDKSEFAQGEVTIYQIDDGSN